ncbi:GNAT family N-acetyltransferase [Amaricoccus sp.]|uniref:GNAT family N-acetyltransferase n=1 Tax=Amaricoccus sp. TaxID=1872485 RepID=UPI001B4FA802|nr:GNAT family N-acetyltransferase [Amaricoccus sp.]MBP7241564.1 GNAT family N-acetyltransferase [Amaricoccus sp.]
MDPFDALFHTWPPAETRRVGPWLARRGDGGGKRVSCATLHGDPGDLDALAATMRAWEQPTLVMVREDEAALDARLAAAGHAVVDPSLMLVGEIAAVADGPLSEEAIDCDAPLACMAALWQAEGVGPGRRAVMSRVTGPRTWLLGRRDQTLGAAAFVAVHEDTAMIHALAVAAPLRHRGLGALMTRTAAAWAAGHGATTLALAVAEANGPARALYAGLGMREAARYHFRLAP